MKTRITRRSALKTIGMATATWTLPGCTTLLPQAQRSEGAPKGAEFNPIDRTLDQSAPKAFTGDAPLRAHNIFWDKSAYLNARGGFYPSAKEKVPLVIVGGGMSGLISAWLLKDHKPVLLERADRLGGNSRGESWNGLDYSIGAAYFVKPDEGSDVDKLLRELGVMDAVRLKTGSDPVGFKGKRYEEFWKGETDPKNRRQFEMLRSYFEDVNSEKNGRVFPELPIVDPQQKNAIAALDRKNFKQHLEEITGAPLHPHIDTALQHYCWSSLGSPSTEVSAAAALNFYASEFGQVCVAPGGNSFIAEALVKRLTAHLSAQNLRTGSIVSKVEVANDRCLISYEDPNGTLRTIESEAVILACPKFVVKHVLNGIEDQRRAAIEKLRYHSYLVANVLMDKPLPEEFYDLFLIGDGAVDSGEPRMSSDRQKVTDVVLANFASPRKSPTVLTLYRGFPYDGARPLIYAEESFERYRNEFLAQVAGEIVPLLGREGATPLDIRMARWGHPLPSADQGLIASGIIDQIRAPFQKRVFFVEQDNWMLPAFESSAGEAFHWSAAVADLLKT